MNDDSKLRSAIDEPVIANLRACWKKRSDRVLIIAHDQLLYFRKTARPWAAAHRAAAESPPGVAVIWPPGRAPIIVTAYYAEARATDDERNAVLAEVGRLVTVA